MAVDALGRVLETQRFNVRLRLDDGGRGGRNLLAAEAQLGEEVLAASISGWRPCLLRSWRGRLRCEGG